MPEFLYEGPWFGLRPPPDAPCARGDRGIYTDREYGLDILVNRKQWASDKAHDQLNAQVGPPDENGVTHRIIEKGGS